MRFFKDKNFRRQNLLVAGGFVLSFVLVAGFCLSLIPTKSLAERAQTINRGDTKETVRKILGRPTGTFMPQAGKNVNFLTLVLCVQSETWAYGHWFHKSPSFPYVFPNLRLFKPDTNDISVVFDSSDKVVNVYIPGLNVSK